jgi:hypothetical protein
VLLLLLSQSTPMADSEKAVVWAATATGGILAATAIYWVLQKALDAYVPYQVGHAGSSCSCVHVLTLLPHVVTKAWRLHSALSSGVVAL